MVEGAREDNVELRRLTVLVTEQLCRRFTCCIRINRTEGIMFLHWQLALINFPILATRANKKEASPKPPMSQGFQEMECPPNVNLPSLLWTSKSIRHKALCR